MTAIYDSDPHHVRVDRAIAKLGAAQYGVFSRAQAFAMGATEGMVRTRLRARRWERLYPGVYRLAGSPPSWRQTLIAAVLAWGPRSVASHRAAAAVWRLASFDPGPIDLIVPRGCKGPLRGTIHRPLPMPAVDIAVHEGIPVTAPERTLIDVAGVVPRDAVEEALDDALRRRLTTIARLRWRLDGLSRQGRPGIAAIRALVEERDPKTPVPESVFETRLLRALRRARLPEPVPQHEVHLPGGLSAFVDFAYPAARLAIEADGYRWHSGRIRWEHDRARRNELTLLGWRVIHVTWDDLHREPHAVVEAVRAALAQAP